VGEFSSQSASIAVYLEHRLTALYQAAVIPESPVEITWQKANTRGIGSLGRACAYFDSEYEVMLKTTLLPIIEG